MAVVVEDHHLPGIGWSYPVCSGPAHESAGTHHSFCPVHLRLSGIAILRGISGLRTADAHRVAYDAIAYLLHAVETPGVTSCLVSPTYAPLTPETARPYIGLEITHRAVA